LLEEVKDDCPRWLAIVLPAMIELAGDIMGLDVLRESSRVTLSYIVNRHKSFLNKYTLYFILFSRESIIVFI